MKLRKLKKADYLLIASNLIPVYGVFFLGWNPIEAFIVYTLETLIIGVITNLRLLVATLYKGHDTWYNGPHRREVSGFFFMAFFTIHFGMFAAIQTAIFSNLAEIIPPGKGMMYFFFHFYEYINRDIAFMLAAFIVSYLAQSFVPFIIRGEYKTTPMIKLMFQPYGRIFIQQVTVIAGSMFLVFGWGKAFILVFALVKIVFEILVNYGSLLDKAMVDMQQEGKTPV
ncbi:MAG: hypothetical protein EOO05_16320 [Chitinophagaceae bacterium]|nr:MAG: hypothetical protein EOO05_16320 [Chitinophagaceae bacterium]